MKTPILAALALASLTAVACTPAASAPPATTTTAASASGAPLDGRTFAVESAKLPDGSTYATNLSFANGILTSSACAKLGYAPGKYTATREGDAVAFRAEMKNGDEVEVWTGRVVGDAIDAKASLGEGKTLAWSGRAAK